MDVMARRVPLLAVVLDWAGTTIDHGSRAPVQALVGAFRRLGIGLDEATARGPMGRSKRDHIADLCSYADIARDWRRLHDRAPSDADVERLYSEFRAQQLEAVTGHCEVIAGVPEAIRRLRALGLSVASTTGYSRELMNEVLPRAAAQGYEPAFVVTADDVAEGRPAPSMNLLAAERLGCSDPQQVVVVDDTPAGMEAGRRAGMPTVGVSLTGNCLGLDAEDVARLTPTELRALASRARQELMAAGADFVIGGVVDLPALLELEFGCRAHGSEPAR